jgi:hypothetical protein
VKSRAWSILGLLLMALVLTGMGGHAVPRPRHLAVLIVGGSAADGWKDRTHQGYVVRGLLDYARAEDIRMHITNDAIPGARVVDPLVRTWYRRWVYSIGPGGVVVLAWGMLNDLKRHTPPVLVLRALHRQIAIALAAHDTVLVVTPPATRVSYGRYLHIEPDLVAAELALARRFHSRHLFLVNVFRSEKAYLQRHHTRIVRVTKGRFHPNTAGARIGGHLMAVRLERIWGHPPEGPARQYQYFPR